MYREGERFISCNSYLVTLYIIGVLFKNINKKRIQLGVPGFHLFGIVKKVLTNHC